jgi:hypothetical protein
LGQADDEDKPRDERYQLALHFGLPTMTNGATLALQS